jgi:hypothetical protein
MKSDSLFPYRLGLLAASASPASALAFSLGLTTFKPEMLRRTENPDEVEQAGEKSTARAPSDRSWLGRIADRLETWSWEREVRAREAYLAQSQDLFDLEARMRHLDGDVLSRGRALR